MLEPLPQEGGVFRKVVRKTSLFKVIEMQLEASKQHFVSRFNRRENFGVN
jgi:hypothetical protein